MNGTSCNSTEKLIRKLEAENKALREFVEWMASERIGNREHMERAKTLLKSLGGE